MPPYHNPVSVVIASELAPALKPLARGRRCWVVTTPGSARRGLLAAAQQAASCLGATTDIAPNPTLNFIAERARAVAADAELLIAIGGGSALDAAKALAALRGVADPAAWLERHVRGGQPYPRNFSPLPIIAIPTTAGTGSEVTMWGSLWDLKEGKKYSVSHPKLYPEHALIVPGLTHSLSYENSLIPALDALSHSMEAIWNRNANPVSDNLAAKAISNLAQALGDRYAETYAHPSTRQTVQQASLDAGLAFSNTKTAIAHSISYPLTGRLGVPHGLACSFTLAEVLRLNGRHDAQRAGLIISALDCTSLETAAEKIYAIYKAAGVPERLKRFIGSREDATGLDACFIAPGRAENNLASVTQEDAVRLIDSALGALGF